uniref:Dihydrofolate synthase/folylpolyglutamate synthase n=1 Tax=Candidatus Aschnera chinzeii TaxID=1485666 RepID=A0AAT9G3Q7_9ENTR|nr:MAG: bifunctional tetrahydrofolate synthase/dihydrofolate synthase [Candidatus Aschnera chinzeii]
MFKKNFSLTNWLEYLSKQHHKTIDLDLNRISIVAKRLNLLELSPTVITVAGTNGKGTTCHLLEKIFLYAGLKVGVYNSPHLIDYRERVRIQGDLLDESKYCDVFDAIEFARGDVSLTYFEYGTLAALLLFKYAQLDVIILEVGLGGRLDATNIIDSTISVITNIALDHVNWLGDNVEQIGYQKSGIFRANCYAVIGECNIPNSVYHTAKLVNTKLFCYGKDWYIDINDKNWNWYSLDHNYKNLSFPQIPLANASTALAVIKCLTQTDIILKKKISLEAIQYALLYAKLPGRFHIINHAPQIILDVAHNPHAASYLANKLSKLSKYKNSKIFAVIGMLIDKDIKNTLLYLSPYIDHWYLASLNEARGASADELAQYVNSSSKFITVKDAWTQVLSDVSINDIIIVCGSFHTVAEVMKLYIK